MTARCGRRRLERDLAKLIESNSLVRACVNAGRKNRMSERQILLMTVGMLAVTVEYQREITSAVGMVPVVGTVGIVHDRPGIQLVDGSGRPNG